MYVQQKQHLKHGNSFEKIIPKAKLILKEYALCDNCVGRLFVKNSGFKSNKLLGKRIKNTLKKTLFQNVTFVRIFFQIYNPTLQKCYKFLEAISTLLFL